MSRYAVVGVALWSLLGLWGCRGFHLYSAENHEMAKAARTNFAEARLDELVKQEYVLNQEILDHQLVVARRHTLALRDAILVQVLDGHEDAADEKGERTWGYLDRKIEGRLDELGVVRRDDKEVTNLPALMAERAHLEGRIAQAELALKTTEDVNAKAVFEGVLKRAKDAYERNAKESDAELLKLNAGGVVPRLIKELQELQAGRASIQEEVNTWSASYAKQKEEHEKATASPKEAAQSAEAVGILQRAEAVSTAYGTFQSASAEEQEARKTALTESASALEKATETAKDEANKSLGTSLLELAKKLPDDPEAVKGLEKAIKDAYEAASKKGNPAAYAWIARHYLGQGSEKLEKKNAVVEELALEKHIAKLRVQLDELNELLEAFVTNKGEVPSDVDPKTQTRIQIAYTFRAVADNYVKTRTFPSASSLVLEAERLRIELEAAKQRVARAEARVELLTRKLEAAMREVESLADARDSLKRVKAVIKPPSGVWAAHPRSLAEDYAAGDQNLKRMIARTLYDYANSWTLGRVAEEELDYRLIALTHDAASDATAVAVQQWNNLVLVPLSSLEAYHASGMTPEQIASFLQAAGLVAVGVGVNR